MLVHVKLQLGCLLVLLYIALIYFKGARKYKQNLDKTYFDELLWLGIVSVIFDGVTAWTVNNTDVVSHIVNLVLHAFFLISIDTCIFSLFLYMLYMTGSLPKRKNGKAFLMIPYVLNIIVVLYNIGSLEFIEGKTTNYSMGISAYTCFIMAAVYALLAVFAFCRKWNTIAGQKRISIFTYIVALVLVTGTQMIFHEVLLTSIAVTIFVLGVYMNLEDPIIHELSRYHHETIMGFANLIENRDDSTGGHIKRTSKYVKLIAEELYNKGLYRDVLTKDYISNLVQAAPMHDIGKISVPDAILQKPGKLTDEEFDIMKLHAQNGGKIIEETFKSISSEEYFKMAYEVARFHHEKWNGKGYPDGLKEEEIPLCARIMAVADVFDAISEKRCYREAMPMDKCFAIIEEGSGWHFEPAIAEAFLNIRPKVEKVHFDFVNTMEKV